MSIHVWNRREMLAAGIMGLLMGTRPLKGQQPPVEYFEGLRWYERRPGSVEPRVLDGKLVLNRKEEKVVYYSGYTSRFEIPLSKLKSLTYEFAQRPSDLTVPVSEWTKAFKRGRRHYLTMKYQDKEGYFKEELLELDKKTWSELLTALEHATGLETKRM